MTRRWALLPAAVVGLLAAQAGWTRRRYGGAPPPDPVVDLVVRPNGATESDDPPYRLVALGDSGMSGVGADSVAGILSVQVAQRLADTLGRVIHVRSHARSGARTADVLHDQVPAIPLADGVVLLVGTNDIVHRTPLPVLRRDTGALLDALGAVGAPVVMSSLPDFRAMRAMPRPLRGAVAAYGRAVDGLQRRQASTRPGVTLVDVRRQAGPAFLRDPATLSDDAFHPSAHGYGLIADALAPALVAALRPSAPPATAGAGRESSAKVTSDPAGGRADQRV